MKMQENALYEAALASSEGFIYDFKIFKEPSTNCMIAHFCNAVEQCTTFPFCPFEHVVYLCVCGQFYTYDTCIKTLEKIEPSEIPEIKFVKLKEYLMQC